MRPTILILAVTVGLLAAACSHSAPKEGIDYVDDYLRRWDRFAQGANDLGPVLRLERPHFESALSALLKAGDERAVARLVFYPVIQVGGFLEVDSDLGHDATKLFGPLPEIEDKNGKKVIFAGDIYFWWQDHAASYPHLPLFDEWQKRDFARTVVIPMYQGVRDRERSRANKRVDPTPGTTPRSSGSQLKD